jgi:alanine racemase
MPVANDMIKIIQSECHVRVDLSRYGENIRILKGIAGPDRELMAVLKADAYGHGAVQCARVALESGATQLAVARVWEGIRLRRAGIEAPILVLGGPNLGAIDLATDAGLTLTVGTEAAVTAVIDRAAQSRTHVKVHLKLDTGLHRYGALPGLAGKLARLLDARQYIDLEGVYAHFSSADELEQAETLGQISVAENVIKELEDSGIRFRYIHLPNSAATISGMTGRSNLVRDGIATYGLAPSPNIPLPDGIRPVLSVQGKPTRVFMLPGGEGISYGLTYRASEDELDATIPIGYADGLPRSLSNAGWFIVDGHKCPIHGRVCMDQTVVGVPVGVTQDSIVTVIGDGSDGAMTIDDVARVDGTINYEIATRMSARMPRVYFRDGEPVHYEVFGLKADTL